MKAIHLPRQKFFFFLLACAWPSLLLRAQDPEKRPDDGSIRIRIEREKDGKKHIYEHTYRADELISPPGSSFWFSDSLEKGFGTDQDFRMLHQPLEKFFRQLPGDSLENKNRFFPFNPTDLQSLLEDQDGMKKFRFHLGTDGDSARFQFRLDTLNGNLPSGLLRDFEWKTDPFGKFPFGADRVELDEKDYQVQELKTDQGKKYIITRRKRPDSRPSTR
ncbi:MAG: hypothetical protein H7Z75_01105 [Ferruginibacter sp.]|nr:hypothetical protein [Cytophagales bacterium]